MSEPSLPTLPSSSSLNAPALVLGSTSPYRRELLQRLGLSFSVQAPQVDETAMPGEAPAALATRLATAKARAAALLWASQTAAPADAIVIGSDQVADLHGQALGKPGHHAGAVAQLQAMRGQTVLFQTAVCVLRPATGFERTVLCTVSVGVRDLSDEDIEAYLQREQPYDCAGSAKVEGLGITLLRHVHADDPTTLIGLPLIATTALLREAGLDPLRTPNAA
jgi:septum formation protein